MMDSMKLLIFILHFAWCHCWYDPLNQAALEGHPCGRGLDTYSPKQSSYSYGRDKSQPRENGSVLPGPDSVLLDKPGIHEGSSNGDACHPYQPSQSHRFFQGQSELCERFNRQDPHSSESSHSISHSVPTRFQMPNHHENTPQASNKEEGMFHPWDCDIPEIPLLPYHVLATLRYPLKATLHQGRRNDNPAVHAIISQALLKSRYGDQTPMIPRFFFVENKLHPETDPQHRFLNRLCLRNLEFLLGINEDMDDKMLAEMARTLDWLHEIRDTSAHRSKLHSDIAYTVDKFLTTIDTPESVSDAQVSVWSSNKTPKNVSKHQAEEQLVILLILENYYRSTNKEKWDYITQGNQYSFLKYFLGRAADELSSNGGRGLDKHWESIKTIQGSSLLPWANNEIIPNLSSPWGKLFTNMAPRSIYDVIKHYVKAESEEEKLKAFQRFDTKSFEKKPEPKKNLNRRKT